ncbi:MAG: acyltransferase family protein [Deltaproteobacteria bacterium]|nr:acyltransferase family protein [Deltaproteobacteria bacterium]MBN2674686.1 acyltransferase family protein [Deltaproteobacteria bacterium]
MQEWLDHFTKWLSAFEKLMELPFWMMEKLEHTLPPSVQERLQELCDETHARQDPFGMDFNSIRSTLAVTAFFYSHYFRCRSTGFSSIPEGPAIFAANHAGQLPFDAMMVSTALFLEPTPPILCRSMMDRLVPSLPVVSSWYAKLGVVLGTEQNAQYLLNDGQKLLTFPEGVSGIQKPLSQAYELKTFGLGFLRLALKHQVPIVPVSIVGSEEQYPTLYNLKRGTHLLNVPSIPIWLHMPIPLFGLFPLPTKYYIHFGEPLYFKGDPDDDDEVIRPMTETIKDAIRLKINELRESRRSVFY